MSAYKIFNLFSALFLFAHISIAKADEPIDYFFNGAKNSNTPHIATLPPARILKPLKVSGSIDYDIKDKLDDILDGVPSGGLAALALKDGEIIYQRYTRSDEKNLYPSWSMAKSFTALTLGYALCDGSIKSLDDVAETYSASLKNTIWGKAKIKDLLTMSSGASKKELDPLTGDYHPNNPVSLTYLLRRGDLSVTEAFRKYGNMDGESPSGVSFSYNNMDTQALAAVIEGATGMPFQEYFQKTLWEDSGAQFESIWHLDKNRQALASAFFFATIQDYARLSQLIVDAHQGRLKNSCVASYIKEATTYKRSFGNDGWYGYQFWLGNSKRNAPIVKLIGHQGQEIFINYKNGKIIILTAYSPAVRAKYRDPSTITPWLIK